MGQIPSLPPVPLLERPLEGGWVLVGALALLACACLWVFMHGRRKQGLIASGVCICAAVALGLVSFLVVTEREVLQARSAALAAAVDEADMTALSAIVHPSVELESPRGQWEWERVSEFIQNQMQAMYAVHAYDIKAIEATIDGPNVARTLVHITVEPEMMRFPMRVVVLLNWQRIDGAWRVVHIEAFFPDVAS